MRILLTLIMILLSIKSYACECLWQSTMQKIESSDYVAQVKIRNIERDSINPEYLNLDIEVLNGFKGDLKNELKILTNDSMCNLYTPIGTEWLVYASFDKNNNMSFGYCSGSIQIDRAFDKDKYPNAEENYLNSTKRKLELLKFLKQRNMITKSDPNIVTALSSECFDSLKGFDGKTGEFAVYEVTINKDLSINSFIRIKDFSNSKLNSQVDNCLNNVTFRIREENKNLKGKIKKIIPVFYYAKDEDNTSFISTADL